MQVFRYETPINVINELKSHTIFLAGPTVRGHQTHLQPSWRFAAIEEFKKQNFNGNIIVPEFTSLTESDKHRPELPIWENAGLEVAHCIMFWIPRTRELIGLTTNFEIGYWAAKDKEKVTYGRPNDSYRNEYIDIMWKKINENNKSHGIIFSNLENLVNYSMCIAEVNKYASEVKQLLKNPPEIFII